MILADSVIWIDHLRSPVAVLDQLLEKYEVLSHPFIIGELAVGQFKNRDVVLQSLQKLPQASLVDHDEVLRFISQHRLYAQGVGYIDIHLLASTALTPGASFWTRDRRLREIANRLQLSFDP